MTNPIDSLTNRTPIRLSIAQMVCLVGTIISGSVAVTITVQGGLHEVRDSVRDVRATADVHTKQLSDIQAQLVRLQTESIARDLASANRLSEWSGWRWNVTADLHTLGKVTKTDIWTRGNP